MSDKSAGHSVAETNQAAAARIAAKVQVVFAERFAAGVGDQRSAAYKAGFRTRLLKRFGATIKVQSPYPAGTAEFDAYYAGADDATTWPCAW